MNSITRLSKTLRLPTLWGGFLRKVVSALGQSSRPPKPTFQEIWKNGENLPEITPILEYLREELSSNFQISALTHFEQNSGPQKANISWSKFLRSQTYVSRDMKKRWKPARDYPNPRIFTRGIVLKLSDLGSNSLWAKLSGSNFEKCAQEYKGFLMYSCCTVFYDLRIVNGWSLTNQTELWASTAPRKPKSKDRSPRNNLNSCLRPLEFGAGFSKCWTA